MSFDFGVSDWIFGGARHLFHATLLAAMTWVICATLLRRARPALHATLWTIVLLKFLVPPFLPMSLSWSDVLGRLESQSQVRSPAETAQPDLPTLTANQDRRSPSDPESIPFWALLVALFYVGGVGCLSIRSFRVARRQAGLVVSSSEASPDLRAHCNALCRRMGIIRAPKIRVTVERTSPFVIGLLRPTLLLSRPLLDRLSPDGLEALLVHELAHVRRKDSLVRWLQALGRVMLFFWPPVHWVCRRIDRATELACDQWAVRETRLDPDRYATFLLEVVREVRTYPVSPGYLAFADHRSFLEERFTMILNRSNRIPAKLNWLMIPALGAWTVFALGGGSGGAVSSESKPKVTIHLKGAPADASISADALPEADLDADGSLSIAELKAFQQSNPDQIELWIEEADSGMNDVEVTVKITDSGSPEVIHEGDTLTIPLKKRVIFVSDKAQFLREHPEADSNGDGDLSDEEFREFSPQLPHLAHEMATSSPENVEEIVIHGAGPGEGPVKAFISEGDADILIDVRELLEEHPEADLNADGFLDPEELEQLDLPRKDVKVWVDKDGNQTTTIRFVGEGDVEAADADGDGHITEAEIKAFSERMADEKGEPGERNLIFVRKHVTHVASPLPDLTSEERRAQFLKDHPEADLDGDGKISQEEAEALAARPAAKPKN